MNAKQTGFLGMTMITVFFFSRCFDGNAPEDPRGTAYAGAASCSRCHQRIADSYQHTGHFLSTRVADTQTIAGSFKTDSNKLTIDDSTKIVMEKTDSGLYQTLYVKNRPVSSHSFDLVMGALKGQTYLYRGDRQFYEMPVSYVYALKKWTASPGYRMTDLHFNRPVLKACFECHSSFANENPPDTAQTNSEQNKWILNIDCERCHGPAAAHVQFQEAHPDVKKAMQIVSFKNLYRQQRIDLCAVCHSGTKHVILKSTFGFKMGDALSSFLINEPPAHEPPDVHGNQTQLLAESKCFKMSSIDCSTCHNPHADQRSLINNYNIRCQQCHATGSHPCGLTPTVNSAFLGNHCTDCHMPADASRVITVQTAGGQAAIPTRVVNHRIAIYPATTAIVLAQQIQLNSTPKN